MLNVLYGNVACSVIYLSITIARKQCQRFFFGVGGEASKQNLAKLDVMGAGLG